MKNRPAGWRFYLGWAQACLRHRVRTTLAAAAFFFGSFLLVPFLPTGFIPPDDLSQTQVTSPCLRAAPSRNRSPRPNTRAGWSSRTRTCASSTVGGGAGGPLPRARPASAQGDADHQPHAARNAAGSASRRSRPTCVAASKSCPACRSQVGLGGSSEKYILVLASEDGPRLAEHARVFERELRTLPGIGNIVSTASLVRPNSWCGPTSRARPTSA